MASIPQQRNKSGIATGTLYLRKWKLAYKRAGRLHSLLNTRGLTGGTYIVSIIDVQEDGFVIDDPYEIIREDYNPRNWDDAHWSTREDGA